MKVKLVNILSTILRNQSLLIINSKKVINAEKTG